MKDDDRDFIWEDDPVEEEKPVEENPDFNLPDECEICKNYFKSKNPNLEFAAYQYDKKWK